MTDPLVFDAAHLAQGWLSVFQSTSTDPKDPQFYRTIHVEFHPDGVRLTACDRVTILTAWVPRRDKQQAPPPDIDQAPDATVVAIDAGKRAYGLLKYAYPMATDEDRMEPLPVSLSIEDAMKEGGGQLPFEELAGNLLVFDLPGVERTRLPISEMGFPDWRPLMERFERKSTTALALAPCVIKKLAVLGTWNSGPLVCEMSGLNKVVRVTIGEGPVQIEGRVMPISWTPDVDAELSAAVEDAFNQGDSD